MGECTKGNITYIEITLILFNTFGLTSFLFLKSRFCFKVNEDLAKRDVMFKIGKLWREYKCKLWNEFYDPLMSRSDLIKNVPARLNMEQWAVFVDYRLRPSTVV